MHTTDAIIYLFNIAPSLIVKLTGPYWFHLLTYKQRITIAAICVSSCYVLVNHFTNKEIRLLGVALGAIQGGMGESTFLAMSQFYAAPKKCLVYYSSGTGFAGPAGYFVSLVILPAVKLHSAPETVKNLFATIIGLFVVGMYLLSFFFVLEAPWIDSVRSGTDRGMSEETDDDDATHLLVHNVVEEDVPRTTPVDRDGDVVNYSALDERGSNGDSQFHRVKSVADTLTAKERFYFILSLWPYMVPLLVVYVSEYAMQSGVWTAFALPSTVSQVAERVQRKKYRDLAYKALNLTYQLGVFASRSSGLLFQPTIFVLWMMPTLQCVFWVFYYAVAVNHFFYGWALLVPAFAVGLLGGAVYVNAFTLIDKNLRPEYRELALSATALACDVGILVGNIAGLFCQFCLFDRMDIHVDGSGTCPF